jgi:hypothetical protein
VSIEKGERRACEAGRRLLRWAGAGVSHSHLDGIFRCRAKRGFVPSELVALAGNIYGPMPHWDMSGTTVRFRRCEVRIARDQQP